MKALVIAEHADVARELAGGARGLGADEVVAGLLRRGCRQRRRHGSERRGARRRARRRRVPGARSLRRAVRRGPGRGDPPRQGHRRPLGREDGHRGCDRDGRPDAGRRARHVLRRRGRARAEPSAGTAVYLVAAGVCDAAQASGAGEAVGRRLGCAGARRKATAVEPRERTAADPTKSDVVVAAGRGFAEEADLDLARALADKLGGAIACSRPLTEGVNWLPTRAVRGRVRPDRDAEVYVAAGISGQMQHMVGANRSGCVVRREQGQERPGVQAVRLRYRRRRQRGSAGADAAL